ncbi:exopolyphosphatase [Oleiagrimonas soli]|uniref:Exopolyphosphatase n=1 Tax=Oleiagrimonas soli TaxID=1543381 RepID=A0A099CXB3_9GAMM|nr:Ppx/GppA phosphatase family protein [Oleiagrimonas soli]KGI78384.1 exopolyphosphatase [Oleiagrimonas soli]MBB6183754.1 exopolyphosphatase/guanosine-5'-triphosphate,3'-diphosphate pyrophosphatase [Oleiagrimonas soli]
MSDTGDTLRDGDLLAAADLGSNSFHLVVARYDKGTPRIIDRVRESVRLAAGVRNDGTLDPDYLQRALDCLARFGQRIAGISGAHVRAIATNAVRQLADPEGFLEQAEQALGQPVEVVSGREEGRLIFLGVSHGLPRSKQRRLVIDVGGGSTEFIVGRGLEPLQTESIQVGCVASTLRFFPDGALTAERWQRAQDEIGLQLQQFAADYRELGWSETIGSSGTAKAIGLMVQTLKLSDDGVRAEHLAALREHLLRAGHIDAIDLPALSPERAPIIAGGVAVLEAAFRALGIRRMQVCEIAMREGVLWDLVGRSSDRDPRIASIRSLAARYAVDTAQAARVEDTALLLFEQAGAGWSFHPGEREWLSWAARVHEIGLSIAHSQHHVHAGYILRHADLAGFSRQEQELLAAIVQGHRRKPDPALFDALPVRYRSLARRVAALLRLAVLLRRARREQKLPTLHLRTDSERIALRLPRAWLQRHPLTATDLEREAPYMADLGIRLELHADRG